MTTPAFKPAQYKARQLESWDDASAGWRNWWELIERPSQEVSDRLLELANVRPGHRVLDVATGIGEPAVTAARKVGAEGYVVATDMSPGMLKIARERASSLGLNNLEFLETDTESLDVPDGSFDAALCRWGLMFLPDLGVALARLRAALVPDGRFATSVWTTNTAMFSASMGVMQSMLQLQPPPPGTPTLFALAEPDVLEEALRSAGFSEIQTERRTVMFEWPSADVYVQFTHEVNSLLRAELAPLTDERRSEVLQAIAQAAQQYADQEGTVRMPNETLLVAGQR